MDFTTSFTVEQGPEEVFQSIIDVGGWWTGDIEGSAAAMGDEFTYRYRGFHDSTQRVIEFVPNEKITWSVAEAKLTFVEDPREWVGTDLVFEVRPSDEGTTKPVSVASGVLNAIRATCGRCPDQTRNYQG